MGHKPSIGDYNRCREEPHSYVVMYQEWRHLLFLHWSVDPSLIQPLLPPRLTVDSYNGRAYIGIVPFFMHNVRPRFAPSVPGISNFPELNLRTYVYDNTTNTPGVWFFSLDAYQYIAVLIARKLFSLPYYYSHFQCNISSDNIPLIRYKCDMKQKEQRVKDPLSCIQLDDVCAMKLENNQSSYFEYSVISKEKYYPEEGSLKYFLLERYVLYSYDSSSGCLYEGRVHHSPYEVQEVALSQFDINVALWHNSLFYEEIGGREPEDISYSPGVDVNIYPLCSIGRGSV